MLKKLIAAAFICLLGATYAQTDQLNAKKYWKFRNNFRRDFVKIGPARGEGIPIASRLPIGCKNNVDASGDKGLVRWADGMIFQGHYIGFLATEYRLLKNRGQDVTATLNELYYALNAINRSDLLAEPIISAITENNLPVVKSENLNGFYLRDDADDETYKKWENGKINCRCGEGSAYTRNNMAGINSGGDISRAKTNDHSTPSLDQMSSLLVGIVMINKLLDDGVYVQPTPEDPVMDIKTEAKAIANRLITYAYEHNYYLLDEWGWPVGNGGGELVGTAYPITVIGYNLLGNDYSLTMRRQKHFYAGAQLYYSTLDEDKRAALWDEFGAARRNQVERYESYPNFWIMDIPASSNFEAYNDEPGAELISTDSLATFWHDLPTDYFAALYEDWEDDQKLNSIYPFNSTPIALLPFDNFPLKDFNFTITLNLAVASGVISQIKLADIASPMDNYQLPLIDAILKDYTPAYFDKATFKSLLDEMPVYGGFKFHGQSWLGYDHLGNDSVGPNQIIWSPGWGGEYKWNDKVESNSEIGHQGQFNALDYMYLHNLYYLVYGNEIEEEYTETYDCFCGDVEFDDILALQADDDDVLPLVEMSVNNAISSDAELHSKLVTQMSFLDFCTSNVFSGPTTTSSVDIKQLFDDYHDIGISLNEFQTEEHAVSDGGEVNIESRLVICNTKTLNVLDGGEINLDKGEILIKPGASMVIEGVVNIGQYTKVIVEPEGKIIIKDGGTLNNNGYIQLQEGATFEYEEGATFAMTDDQAEIHFDGGDLVIRENADFTFVKSGSQSGQMRFSQWGAHIVAEENTSFLIIGNGDTDPILILDEDADFWCEDTDLKWVNITSGRVDLYANSRLVSIQDFTATSVHFNGIENNRGLVLFNDTEIANAQFDDATIYAPLFYKNTGTFYMTSSEVNNDADISVKIKGMGYNIHNTVFNGSGYYMLSGQNTTLPSRVSSCTFNGTLTTVGVIDNSNAELEVSKNDFNSLYVGLHKLDGRANIRCNTFSNFKHAGIVAHNNCIADLSSNDLGGYNTFTKNSSTTGTNIALWDTQGLLLRNGYNTFDTQGEQPIISGTMQISPPAAISAHANKWGAFLTEPAPARFTITSVFGGAIPVQTNLPNNASCPNLDSYVSGSIYSVPNLNGTMPTMSSTNFNNVSLDAAIDICINATEQNGGTDDQVALALFEEVLVTYPTMPSSPLTDWLVRYGSQKMKNTLQHLFADGELSAANNAVQFDQHVQRYVNVLNALSSVALKTSNYKQLFYLEMDKVHLFHLLGKNNLAILTLLNTESCGLDSSEQVYVNHWKVQLDEEVKKTYVGYQAEFMDSTWIDTTLYNIPTQQAFGNFGSTIQSAKTIEFYNCGNYRTAIKTDDKESAIDLSIYPNPNQGVFTVNYNLPEKSTGEVIVYAMDGKKVYSFSCQSGEHRQVVDVSGVAPGTYIYSFRIDGIGVSQGKFIVQ